MSGPDMRPPAETAHPLVKLLHDLCVKNMVSRNELARRAGLGEATLQNWWDARGAIIVQNLEAALGVFSYGIGQKVLPPSEPKDGGYRAGECYRTACNDMVRIERVTERRLIGYTLKCGIVMVWNLAGQRIPRGGEDPFDLRPLSKQERAA